MSAVEPCIDSALARDVDDYYASPLDGAPVRIQCERDDWHGYSRVVLMVDTAAGEEAGEAVSGEAYDAQGDFVRELDFDDWAPTDRRVDLTPHERSAAYEAAEDAEREREQSSRDRREDA